MRSAAVILIQHRRSRRLAIHRYERSLPVRPVATRSNMRRDHCNESHNVARVSLRASANSARTVHRRHRPDVVVPRGFLPLVVH